MITSHTKSARRAATGLALGAALLSAPAIAALPTPLYAGGITLSGPVYRNIFNVYSSTAGGDLCVGLSAPCPTDHYRDDVEVLYISVTSANTVLAYSGYDPSKFILGAKIPVNPPVGSTRDFGPYYGTGTGASWVPSGTATNYFPKISFTSGDPLAATDIANTTALGFGPPVQVPSLAYGVVLPFRPTATWNPHGVKPSGASSNVNLQTDVLCGIFTGAITNWNDPAFKKGNGGKVLGNGAVTVVYRHDGAATTLLLANALLNQCGTESHPVSIHPVPDQWLVDNNITNTPPYKANTSFFINVGNAKHLPANFYNNVSFAGVTGGVVTITGMQQAVDATPGAIGYLSSDYAPPVMTGMDGLGATISSAVNVQSYLSYKNKATPKYIPPTAGSSAAIMKSFVPPSFAGGAAAPALSAINWSVFNPTPMDANAYPIGGFAYFDLYSCYKNPKEIDALVGSVAGKLGLIRWWLGSQNDNGGAVTDILNSEGFAPPPPSWKTAAIKLIKQNALSKIGKPGQANTACANISKGA